MIFYISINFRGWCVILQHRGGVIFYISIHFRGWCVILQHRVVTYFTSVLISEGGV